MSTKPTILQNYSLYNDNNGTIKCFITIFKVIHFLLGLDFGFIKYKSIKMKVFIKSLSIIYCLFICVMCFNFSQKVQTDFWSYIIFAQYLLYAILLTIINDDTSFCNLIHNLRTIDIGLKLGKESLNDCEVKLILTVLVTVLNELIIAGVNCCIFKLCQNSVINMIPFVFILISINLVPVCNALSFYAINWRFKKLASMLKVDSSDILTKQHLFKSLVDIAEKNKASYDPIMLVSLVFNVPLIMASIYMSVMELPTADKSEEILLDLGFSYIIVLDMTVLTLMPAVCAGMLNTQVENIRVTLHDTLLQIEDTYHARYVELFLQYVEARPCQFRVYKVIPLDADLLGMVFSFCVTYLIVIVQFTNH